MLQAVVASAQDQFQGRYELDRRLGTGSFKEAWTVKDSAGRPVEGKLLIIMRSRQNNDLLRQEDAQLRRLEAAGVPTAKYLELGSWGGYAAGLQERYVGSNRDWMRFGFNPDGSVRVSSSDHGDARWALSEKTLESVATIRRALDRSGLIVGDAQVLVASDGRVVIADPLGVTSRMEAAFQPFMAWPAFFMGGPRAAMEAVAAPLKAKMNDGFLDVVLRQLEVDAQRAILARRIRAMTDMPGGQPTEEAARRLSDSWRLQLRVEEALAASKDREALRVKQALSSGTITLDFTGQARGAGAVPVAVGDSFSKLVQDAFRLGRDRLYEQKEGRLTDAVRAESERLARELFGGPAAEAPKVDASGRSPRLSDSKGLNGLLDERVRPARDRLR